MYLRKYSVQVLYIKYSAYLKNKNVLMYPYIIKKNAMHNIIPEWKRYAIYKYRHACIVG